MSETRDCALRVKKTARQLSILSTEEKNTALLAIADALEKQAEEILLANTLDVTAAEKAGMTPSLLDRLTLTQKRIAQMAQGCREVAALPDPVGEVMERTTRPNGMTLEKVRVPIGVIGMIYEARPNVTVDSAVLCLKSGNGVLLRGSASAIHSNTVLVKVMQQALQNTAVNENAVGLVMDTTHGGAEEMMNLTEEIDVLIPRGGAKLIAAVTQNAHVPVIRTGVGNCHVYVDEQADQLMAKQLLINAKTQRPSTCNAAETLLIHRNYPDIMGLLLELVQAGVTVHGCEKVCRMFPKAIPAVAQDYADEYLGLEMCVKIVDGTDEAIEHIGTYGTGHTELIITQNAQTAEDFLNRVDAASVNWNVSTRFTDGGEFGFGAEIGIATQKIHARGPLGLRELTIYKYKVRGNGQVRT